MFLISYFSSLEKIKVLEDTPEFFLRDKILHVIEYSILGLLSFNVFKEHDFLKKKIFLYVIMFTFIYAVTDELHQIFVPGRTFSLYDIFADFLGGSLILIKKFI